MPATRPPENPPPGALCPEKSRNSENTSMVWKTSRVPTSKITERRCGARVTGPVSQVRPRPGTRTPSAGVSEPGGRRSRAAGSGCPPPQTWCRSLASARRAARSMRPVRARRKIRDATPVAATTITEISPMVSQARMSTRVTLTMFLPYPNW